MNEALYNKRGRQMRMLYWLGTTSMKIVFHMTGRMYEVPENQETNELTGSRKLRQRDLFGFYNGEINPHRKAVQLVTRPSNRAPGYRPMFFNDLVRYVQSESATVH